MPPESTTAHPPSGPRPGTGRIYGFAVALTAAAALAWLWTCWCAFPDSAWNDLRLAPAFLLGRGPALFPPAHTGLITTWMYGPLPLLLLLPATWAASAYHAVLAAGAINLVTSLAAIVLVCGLWPAPTTPGRSAITDRALAAALAVLLWPWASFQFLQADNLAVALGLVSNLLLIRARGDGLRWAAALLAVACLACKQTSVGVIAAQIVWLGVVVNRKAAWQHLLRGLVGGLGMLAVMIAWFGWRGIWLHLVLVPARLPWTPGPAMRVAYHAAELTVQLVLPALVLVAFRPAIWKRTSLLLLPSLTWLCALPPGLAAFFKAGGTVNSLQGFPLWLPPVLVVAVTAAHRWRWGRRLPAGLALAGLAIGGLRLASPQASRWRPEGRPYRQAAQLARELRGQIWFPCNPLVNLYAAHRYDHDEDGLFMRTLAGFPVTLARLYAHLPPHLSVIAIPRGQPTWGIAERVGPPHKQRNEFGFWTLYSWTPAAPAHPTTPVGRD